MTTGVARSVGGTTLINLGGNGVRIVLSFITLVCASRWLGPDGFGKVSLILAYTTYLLSVLPLGFEHSLPFYASRSGVGFSARVLSVALLASLIAGAVLVLAALVAIPPLLVRAGLDDLFWPVLIFTAQMQGGALLNILFGFLRGAKTFVPYIISEQLLFPALHLAALFVIVRVLHGGYFGYALGYSSATFCCLLYVGTCAFLAWKPHRGERGPLTSDGWRSWLWFSLPLAVMSGFDPFLRSLSVMQAGWFLPPAEVAKFSVAARVTIFVQFLLTAITPVFTPYLADLHRRGDTREFRDLYQTVNYWCSKWAVLLSCLMVAAADLVLSVFGKGYEEGIAICLLLALPGALSEGALGGVRLSLVMAGRNRINAALVVGAIALQLLLGRWLVPRFGIAGVATSFSITYAALNLARAGWFHCIFGIPTLNRRHLRNLAALAVAGGGLAWAIRAAALAPRGTAALAVVVFVPAFAVTFWKDREVFSAALARVRSTRVDPRSDPGV